VVAAAAAVAVAVVVVVVVNTPLLFSFRTIEQILFYAEK
jgi:hypothetical protein